MNIDKLKFMQDFASRNGCTLELEATVGLGRECVGILINGCYPDYEWYDKEYERVDANGDVWTPPNAYHKHPCVAVLGKGEAAEDQLYDWLLWFHENGFKVESITKDTSTMHSFQVLMGEGIHNRMVRK